MRCLVSGGAGFIGSHLVDALVDRGDEVVVIDDLSTGNEANLSGALEAGARLAVADVADFAALGDAVGPERFDRCFHLAAQVDVRISVGEPGRDTRINVEGTVNMLELARLRGCPGFAFASSCAVYGEPDAALLPLAENAPTAPESPYGQGKLAGEGYVEMYGRLYGTAGSVLRFANVYGPRQGSVGEAGVVSIFGNRLLAGEPPTVFGTGEQTRDFVYVGDVVAALIAAADAGERGCFNVGTGVETSVLELIDGMLAASGAEVGAPEMAPARAGEVERMALDPVRAGQALGWTAATPLDEGLRRTWAALAG